MAEVELNTTVDHCQKTVHKDCTAAVAVAAAPVEVETASVAETELVVVGIAVVADWAIPSVERAAQKRWDQTDHSLIQEASTAVRS